MMIILKNELQNALNKYIPEDNFWQSVDDFFSKTEPLKGYSNTEKWAELLQKISLWKEEYLINGEAIIMYGFMTWDLNVNFMLFHMPGDKEDLKEYIIKLLFVNSHFAFIEESFHEDYNFKKRIELAFPELIEFYCSYRITIEEVIADLEHFYTVSYARRLSEQLESSYKKYMQYLQLLKDEWHSCEVIGLNHLGKVDDERMGKSEVSMYFILGEDKLFLISLVDFA